MSEQAADQFATPHERFDARLQRRSATVLKARIAQAERDSMLAAVEAVQSDSSIEHASALIVKARRRFILGSGKSRGYATLLAGDLDASLTHIALVGSSSSDALSLLSDVRATDVLVVVSLSRFRRDTISIAQRFAEAGGVVVLITDSPNSPLAPFAEVQVVVATGSASYTNSPTALVLALHLIASITAASAKGAGRRLHERDRLSTELELYYDNSLD
ncbi:MurR/RpiR family transcriptional regulator [Lysinibacter cavernae]|uniref:DNA-binding MurR/RpiR family transcriptional regulator n=1 Tax=Lysinibacter cavernae TaxID=1640652 RepID=A0A7X5TT14_9MICO|nr:SIS domain-containing protein [Lysinibacter cavernae]NIH52237.1 DNA-binding MurR/RpiR family transcriptional regulator [Lysinibacter cavernae]